VAYEFWRQTKNKPVKISLFFMVLTDRWRFLPAVENLIVFLTVPSGRRFFTANLKPLSGVDDFFHSK
jgi:hypothetical protein